MTRTLTITYEKSNQDISVMCVAESNQSSITVVNMFTGEKAEQLYKELTGQDVVVRAESEKVGSLSNVDGTFIISGG